MKKNTIIGFLAGTAVGAALGLIFAPKSGKEMRNDISKKAKSISSKINDIDLDDIREFVIEKSADIEKKINKLSRTKVLKDAKKLAKEIEKELANLYDSVKDITEDVLQDSVIKLKEKAANTIERVLNKLKED